MRKFFLILVFAAIGSYFWYTHALGPVNKVDAKREQITIEKGMSVESITQLLAEKNMIRSPTAFKLSIAFNGLGSS